MATPLLRSFPCASVTQVEPHNDESSAHSWAPIWLDSAERRFHRRNGRKEPAYWVFLIQKGGMHPPRPRPLPPHAAAGLHHYTRRFAAGPNWSRKEFIAARNAATAANTQDQEPGEDAPKELANP
ncbi:hypothetical protein B0H19DRAFT_1075104 [Mycena capillaripes]|nr:hypothetical protein B0H19DRAFT_1075104 [Mycena capillaripes]